MSEVRLQRPTFLDLYRDGQVTAEQIDDFIEAWHESDDSEQRPLAEYLGMTDEEYSVWLASRRALPMLVAARQNSRPVIEVVRQHLADLQRAGLRADETAIYVLSHWLAKRDTGTGSMNAAQMPNAYET
jgi:hypothetical protein